MSALSAMFERMFETPRRTAPLTAEDAFLAFMTAAAWDASTVAHYLLSDDICPDVFASLSRTYAEAAELGVPHPPW